MTAQIVPLFDEPDLAERRALKREARQLGQGMPYVQLKALDFASFWRAWPKRDNRFRAEREFLKLSPAERLEMMRALPAVVDHYSALIADGRRDYVPDPNNFLRDRRWSDEKFRALDLGQCCWGTNPYNDDGTGRCQERATVKGNSNSPYTGGMYCARHAAQVGLTKRKA
jgi:hypothetical protein